MHRALTAVLAASLLASCGRPDASGIYVYTSDREVALVQLVEAKDGAVGGRLEDVTVTPNGIVNDQSTPIDGAASKHDLMFKPASAWLGGLTATGSFTGGGLTLTGTNFTLNAPRADLTKYRAAVAHLQSVAAYERQQIAMARAARIAQAAQTQAAAVAQAAQANAIRDAENKTATIQAATAQLRNDTARMNAAMANCPDFGGRSAMNTERIANMMRMAPTLSEADRNRLIGTANQVEVGTNQIEVTRSQYAIHLDQIVQDATRVADTLERFCASPQGAQFGQSCAGAKAAAAEYRASFARDRASFMSYKQAVQDEINRQTAMIQRMGG
jgi:hypothetical protein